MSIHDEDIRLDVTPCLHYPDGDDAVGWLTRAVGPGAARAMRDEDGSRYEEVISVGPDEVDIGGGAVSRLPALGRRLGTSDRT